MRVKDNLSSIVNSIGKKRSRSSSKNNNQIGKVYGVVTTENTPTPAMFEKAGKWNGIGTIFYLDYTYAKNVSGNVSDDFLNACKLAKPLNPQIQGFPLLGELVQLLNLPSPAQLSNNSFDRYYNRINLWNNTQQNSQQFADDSLGSTFSENPNTRPLTSYQGDYITQGRQGTSLRFSTTTRGIDPPNEWSQVGNEIDPITILTNGLAYDPAKQYYVEQINKDASSIYLTSAQKIPLQTDKTGVLNNLTNPLDASNYINSQVILNGDRVVLNSKKDEVMLFAKTNIELNTKNTINLNADTQVHLNSTSIVLGVYDLNNPPQPVLLGNDTLEVFFLLTETLSELGSYLQSTISTAVGSPIPSLNLAGTAIMQDMVKLCSLLDKITSQRVFISPNNAVQTSIQPSSTSTS